MLFGVGGAAHLGYDDTLSVDCGSVFLPNFVSTSTHGACEDELAAPRLAILAMAGAVIVLTRFAAANSGSVGRIHTRAWDASLVIGVFAAFVLVWSFFAWLVAAGGAYEPS